MAKVRFKARVNLSTGYAPVKYITRTIEMEIPTNSYGFILFAAMHEPIRQYFEQKIIPQIKEKVSSFSVLHFQIIDYRLNQIKTKKY